MYTLGSEVIRLHYCNLRTVLRNTAVPKVSYDFTVTFAIRGGAFVNAFAPLSWWAAPVFFESLLRAWL
jgi:hypothetical protein